MQEKNELISFDISPNDIAAMSPTVLAFIGDTVYDLFIRTNTITENRGDINKMHRIAVSMVNAHAQSVALHRIEQHLTEQEQSIFKRGRNAKSGVPKNADVLEYRAATGLECLIGYLYLNKEYRRLNEIMNLILINTKDEASKHDITD